MEMDLSKVAMAIDVLVLTVVVEVDKKMDDVAVVEEMEVNKLSVDEVVVDMSVVV